LKGSQLLPQHLHLILHLARSLNISSGPVECLLQNFHLHRLFKKVKYPQMNGMFCRIERTVTGEDNNGDVFFEFADFADELDS